MIGKLIAKGGTRSEAIARLRLALDETRIEGVKTNIDYLLRVLMSPEFEAGEVHTGLGAIVQVTCPVSSYQQFLGRWLLQSEEPTRKNRYTEEQMVAVLRGADRTSVAEASKKHKVSEPTSYAWRKHFGQMQVADVKRLKALQVENARPRYWNRVRGGIRRGAFGRVRISRIAECSFAPLPVVRWSRRPTAKNKVPEDESSTGALGGLLAAYAVELAAYAVTHSCHRQLTRVVISRIAQQTRTRCRSRSHPS